MKTALHPTTKKSDKRGSLNPALQVRPEFLPDLLSVSVTDKKVICLFEDGRSVSFPISWSRKLAQATVSQCQGFEFNAHYIFWDKIDEITGVRNILLGKQLQWQ